jgi:hypothetical protein
MTRTPETISAMPAIAALSKVNLKTTTLIIAVRTIPKPPQIAYATPRGMVFNARERKNREVAKHRPMIRIGIGLLNCSVFWRNKDPVTSQIIAKARAP